MGLRSELTARILRLPGVELRLSRFTGDEAFFALRREIAHFHGERTLDIRLTRARILTCSDPRVTRRRGSDWCEFAFSRRADLGRALRLVREALLANG